MGVTKVVDIIQKAQTIVQDTTGVTWPKAELLGWFNDAQKEVVVYRPDANPVTADLTCAATSKQSVPAGGLTLLTVVRNINGNQRAVTQIERRILDEQLPGWHNYPTAGADNVEHFVFDPVNPKVFYLFPKPKNTVQVEIIYSMAPADVVSVTAGSDPNDLSDIANQVIAVDDTYRNAILDYILYRCYQKDTTYAGSREKAMQHQQGFMTTMTGKIQVDGAAAPRPSSPSRG